MIKNVIKKFYIIRSMARSIEVNGINYGCIAHSDALPQLSIDG